MTWVRIREAHANDEWPNPSSSNQPEGKVLTSWKFKKEKYVFLRWLTSQVTAALRIESRWPGGWRRRWGLTQTLRCWWTAWRTPSTRSLRPGPSGTSSPRRGGCCTRLRTASTTTCLTKSPFRTSSGALVSCVLMFRKWLSSPGRNVTFIGWIPIIIGSVWEELGRWLTFPQSACCSATKLLLRWEDS